MDDYEPYFDEAYEIDSALGSAGMGTDEYYQPGIDIDQYEDITSETIER